MERSLRKFDHRIKNPEPHIVALLAAIDEATVHLTGLVDRLEKRNLVKRTAVPGDRRLYNVALTPQGSTIMEEILPLYHESAVRLWEGVTDDRIQALLSDLESVIQQSQTIARELSESSATAQRNRQ